MTNATMHNTVKPLEKVQVEHLDVLYPNTHNMKDFGFNTFEKLYNSCVIPILDYNSAVWGFKQYKHIDNVQTGLYGTIWVFTGSRQFSPS